MRKSVKGAQLDLESSLNSICSHEKDTMNKEATFFKDAPALESHGDSLPSSLGLVTGSPASGSLAQLRQQLNTRIITPIEAWQKNITAPSVPKSASSDEWSFISARRRKSEPTTRGRGDSTDWEYPDSGPYSDSNKASTVSSNPEYVLVSTSPVQRSKESPQHPNTLSDTSSFCSIDLFESIDLEAIVFSTETQVAFGGACDLFVGDHPRYGKVALKRPRINEDSVESEILHRFEREAAIWKRVSDSRQNILPLLGVLRRQEYLYIVTPWIADGDVLAVLTRNRTMDKFKLLTDISSALVYLHELGIVHGDIKGKNILINGNGDPLICDFGLAKIVVEGMVTSDIMKGVGSTRWMAPELFDMRNHKTMASDVYAFGMTIVEILTGKPPYSHIDNAGALLNCIIFSLEQPPRIPSHSPTGEPYDDLWSISEECRQRDLLQRPTMARVHDVLSAIQIHRLESEETPHASHYPLPRP